MTEDFDGDLDLETLEADELEHGSDYIGQQEPTLVIPNLPPIRIGQHELTPVEMTDAVYQSVRDEFGSDEAESLQRLWGDRAVQNQAAAHGMLAAHPELSQLYADHATDTGGLSGDSAEAFGAVLAAILDKAGVPVGDRQEISAIADDHSQPDGSLSLTGLAEILRVAAKKTGGRRK